MSTVLAKKKFSVREFHRMAESGILHEDERVELINGEIVEMAPIGTRHYNSVIRLTNVFADCKKDRFIISVQNPILLDDQNELYPDMVLVKPTYEMKNNSVIDPRITLLVIEVGDSSHLSDRVVKVPLYATCGVAETWLVNLVEEQIEVYRNPDAGAYHDHQVFRKGQTISPAAFSDIASPVDAVLGN